MGETVLSLLSELSRPADPPRAESNWLRDRGPQFRADIARIAGTLRAEWGPLRVTKERLSAVLACQRSVLAPRSTSTPSPQMVLGRLVDLVMHHHVIAGGVAPGTAYDVAFEALWADGDDETIAVLSDVEAWARTNLEEHATRMARQLGPISPGWWPRCERRVEVQLADGAVVATGRFDLYLGGPGTGRPGVIVELKSGGLHGVHPDARWYALLATLRDGAPPYAVCTLGTDRGEVAIEIVRDEVLESAARRLVDASELLVALAAGRPPTTRPQPRCSWCSLQPSCADGQQWVSGRSDTDDLSPGLSEVDDLDHDPGAW